jgi:hypothetical protein
MSIYNATTEFTYHESVNEVVDLTDTTDYNLCVIGRVNHSTKCFVVHDHLDVFGNFQQVPLNVQCERIGK